MYIACWESLSDEHGNKLTIGNTIIRFADADELPSGRAGLCQHDLYTTDNYFLGSSTQHLPNRILINKNRWNDYKDVANYDKKLLYSRREFILFHELAHCVLGKEHNENYDSTNKRYESMMYSKFPIYGYMYINNYSYYLSELFDQPEINIEFDLDYYLGL